MQIGKKRKKKKERDMRRGSEKEVLWARKLGTCKHCARYPEVMNISSDTRAQLGYLLYLLEIQEEKPKKKGTGSWTSEKKEPKNTKKQRHSRKVLFFFFSFFAEAAAV